MNRFLLNLKPGLLEHDNALLAKKRFLKATFDESKLSYYIMVTIHKSASLMLSNSWKLKPDSTTVTSAVKVHQTVKFP